MDETVLYRSWNEYQPLLGRLARTKRTGGLYKDTNTNTQWYDMESFKAVTAANYRSINVGILANFLSVVISLLQLFNFSAQLFPSTAFQLFMCFPVDYFFLKRAVTTVNKRQLNTDTEQIASLNLVEKDQGVY